MWVRKRTWLEMVALGGFALPHIWMRTLLVTCISIVTTVVYEEVPELHYSLTPVPFTLVGLPLGIFLGFRNNTAYDRFWEGRKLWGSLVNTSRTIVRQIITFVEPLPEADREESTKPKVLAYEREIVHLVIAYVHALRYHLRDEDPREHLGKLLPDEIVAEVEREDNVPLAILHRLAEYIVSARRRHWIHPFHLPVIDASLTALTDIQGACERIKSTPIPYSYTVLMHRIVAFYCAFLPFGLMDTVKWATPVVVLAISYCFFGLDAVGEEVEQPFGLDTNDLALEAISITIERNLRVRIGEDQPPIHQPVKGVLT